MVKRDREEMKRGLLVAQLRSYLNSPFLDLREYFDSVERLFNNQLKKIAKSNEQQIIGLSQEEKDQFYEWQGEEYWNFKDSFPNIHRNSLFITMYCEFEEILKFICVILLRKKRDIDKAKQIYESSSGILDKIKSCLTKDIGIKWSPNSVIWEDIKKINQIRNKIVHSDGWLDSTEEKELVDYINKNKKSVQLILKDAFYKIQLTDLFIPETFDKFEQLLNELFEPMSNWIKNT